jgi:hypothetical protein
MDTSILDAERSFYAGAFGIGLLTSVYAMLNGTVRMKADPAAIQPPPAAFNAPVIGAAVTTFGAVGYLLAKYSHLDAIVSAIVAVLAAAAGWAGMAVLMAKWALRGPIVDPHEELEELQGTVATVTRPIAPDAPGEILYSFRGQLLHVPARNVGGEPVEAGTEVVIEKIENGVADVELWSVVEQRL